MRPVNSFRWIACVAAFAGSVLAQTAQRQYIVMLADPPLASRFASREAMARVEAATYRQRLMETHANLRRQLKAEHVAVIGDASIVLNAIFVAATPDRLADLAALPGVAGIAPVRHLHRNLNRATALVSAPVAWTALGGATNAGAGIKIAILDTGIDQNSPAFQDPSLAPPPAFTPVCDPASINTCSQPVFTNNKVIVARSYVGFLAAGGAMDPNHPELDSRPDDLTPRDHDGHGTAVASCAAGVSGTVTPSSSSSASGSVAIGGVAPKAWLGNYRIYGSPEVNDTTTDAIVIAALDDAVADGMDVVNFSSGAPAPSGPLDTGAACGNPTGMACDALAQAFENAAQAGVVIVASAGNDGAPGTIESPADAPSVIAVGATTNSHFFTPTVSALAASAPANVRNLAAIPSDSASIGAVTGELRDVTTVGDDGTACSPLPAFSLPGFIALIERGNCTFATKVQNAEDAGAIGVLIYDDGGPTTAAIVSGGFVPVLMISQSDGTAMKAWIDANPYQEATLDPAGAEHDDSAAANQFAEFSSQGPTVGALLAKPELVAPGESPASPGTANATPYYYGGIYMASETYDPLGEMFSSTGFAAADGTSFSSPITAGAAALMLQAHPGVTGAARLPLVRSGLISNAAQTVTADDQGGIPVDQFQIGAGLLDAGAAVSSAVTVTPATLSFGVLGTSLPAQQQFTLTNNGAAPVTLSLAVAPNTTLDPPSTVILQLSSASVSLAAGASATVKVTATGSVPAPGYYSGLITISGSGVSEVAPYVYVVGDGLVNTAFVEGGAGPNGLPFDGTVNQPIPATFGNPLFELVDDFYLPIPNAPVTWSATNPDGSAFLLPAGCCDSATNQYGIAGINRLTLGSQAGTYTFTASVAGQVVATFSGNARTAPAIRGDSPVLNAASFDGAIAPGSYAAIFGSGLSDPALAAAGYTSASTDISSTLRLPEAIDYVTVSFDVPSAAISVPGHLTYVSPTQVNVQVPWELQGQTAALMKVTIDYTPGNVVTVPLQPFAPGIFGTPAQAAAVDGNHQPITQSNPAVRGQQVQLFANGLGPVTNQPASGDPAPVSGNPQCQTLNAVTVNMGSPATAVAADFAGLAPGSPGLYVVGFRVPVGLSPGNQPVTVSVGGATSKASAIQVK